MNARVSRFRILPLALILFFAAVAATPARAGAFLDIQTLTPGIFGAFTGTLDGIGVGGSITAVNSFFEFNATGTDYFHSTTDNSSPQYSYASVYAPTIGKTDRVGYTLTGGQGQRSATITINFRGAITNPVFHVANLDSMIYDFAPTAGLGGLTLLSGNGSVGEGSDGLLVTGTVISDKNQLTIVGQSPTEAPFLTGARSAYGSVQLNGTFTTLVINVTNPLGGDGDGGSFTLSTAVPEPSTLATAGIGLAGLGLAAYRRRRAR